ncbi:hypothetical protein GCM10027199_25690 [Amycolatopsis magusensis]
MEHRWNEPGVRGHLAESAALAQAGGALAVDAEVFRAAGSGGHRTVRARRRPGRRDAVCL